VTVYDHSLLHANLIVSTKTVGYEVLICLPSGKMVVRKPTNLESISSLKSYGRPAAPGERLTISK
jgi:hypothetical protein